MLTIICFGFLLIFFIAVLFDVSPLFLDWYGRIRIGRYTDTEGWRQSILHKGSEWLNRTPHMKVTDQTRWTLLERLQGKYASRTIQHWQEAALLMGLAESLRDSPNRAIEQQIDTYLHRLIDPTGQWRNPPQTIDAAILAYGLMQMHDKDMDVYKPALDAMWTLIMEHIGQDGTVMYRKHMPQYRYVDTLGFICPFLITYGLRFEKDECIELALRQLDCFAEFGLLDQEWIPCHAYELQSKLPLGLFGWGRGLAWYAIGMMDSWRALPEDHPSSDRLKVRLEQFASMAMAYQQPSGAWNWTVTRPEARADSSATAVLAWYLMEMSRIAQDQKIAALYAHRASQALAYLKQVTCRNGIVDFSQGDTKDIGVYSMLFNKMPFTQGFSIRASLRNQRKGSEKFDQTVQAPSDASSDQSEISA